MTHYPCTENITTFHEYSCQGLREADVRRLVAITVTTIVFIRAFDA